MLYWWQIPPEFGAHPLERMANYKRHQEIEAEVQRRLAEERLEREQSRPLHPWAK